MASIGPLETGVATASPVLRVEGLRVEYDTPRGPLVAVNDVEFQLKAGERFGLVGESGSGKSTVAHAMLRLIKPPGRIVAGKIELEGMSLLELSAERMRQVRLERIALVTQGALNSLNPVLRVRDQIRDALEDHGESVSGTVFSARLNHLLDVVGLRRSVASMYPHELSGGMRQRVCIAIAISLRPRVIIADEPTSALDVVVQRQIMTTLRRVQEDVGASIMLIGHDIGLMAQTVDTLAVMYAGDLVEVGPTRQVLRRPLHPYTQGLLASLPSLESKRSPQDLVVAAPSIAPSEPASIGLGGKGAPFLPRCPVAIDRCAIDRPTLREIEPEHWVACHLY
jgi:peptide/nickel transport system ATP-binding protein